MADINLDGSIDFNTDLMTVVNATSSRLGDSSYVPNADLDLDGNIDFTEWNMVWDNLGMIFPAGVLSAGNLLGITGYKLVFEETLENTFASSQTVDYYWSFSVDKWDGTQWIASGISDSNAPVTEYSISAQTTVNLPYFVYLLPSPPDQIAVAWGEWLRVHYTFHWTYGGTNYVASDEVRLNVHPGDTAGAPTVTFAYLGADCKVSTADLTLLASHWGQVVPWEGYFDPTDALHRADTGMYGKVSTGDLTILSTEWGNAWTNTPPS